MRGLVLGIVVGAGLMAAPPAQAGPIGILVNNCVLAQNCQQTVGTTTLTVDCWTVDQGNCFVASNRTSVAVGYCRTTDLDPSTGRYETRCAQGVSTKYGEVLESCRRTGYYPETSSEHCRTSVVGGDVLAYEEECWTWDVYSGYMPSQECDSSLATSGDVVSCDGRFVSRYDEGQPSGYYYYDRDTCTILGTVTVRCFSGERPTTLPNVPECRPEE